MALDRNRRVTAVPYQKPGAPASAGLTVQQCKAAAWAVTPDGQRYQGAEAINIAISAALGTRILHGIYGLPMIKQLQDLVYDQVAANRSRLPGDEPYCSQHPNRCR